MIMDKGPYDFRSSAQQIFIQFFTAPWDSRYHQDDFVGQKALIYLPDQIHSLDQVQRVQIVEKLIYDLPKVHDSI